MKNFNTKIYKRKIFRTISKFKLIEDGDKIFIGLSGGKDSGAACYLISEYIREKKVKCELVSFFIKLGDFVPDEHIDTVEKQAEICKIPLKIYDVKNYGIDFKKLKKHPRPICSSCGIVKRYLMNKIPREEGANKLCTGHHGDDFIVFFMKNILGNNIDWIGKFTPLLPGRGKQLSRIRPLFFVGGKNNKKFCDEIKFPYVEEDKCPYIFLKQKIDKRRKKWYETIENIEMWQPDFKEHFLKGIISITEKIKTDRDEIKECEICGEPTSEKICAFCRILKSQEKYIGN